MFSIRGFSGDCRFRRYGILVLPQGPFWRGCRVVAAGCSGFSFPRVWTYPEVCLLVIEIGTGKTDGEGWL